MSPGPDARGGPGRRPTPAAEAAMTAAAEPAEAALGARPGRPRAGEVDLLIGRRMRERRLMLGITVQELAAVLGLPYQQLHKYETGVNRLSAGRLYQLAEALGVEVAYFFGGDEQAGVAAPAGHPRLQLDLLRNFAPLPHPEEQEAGARPAPPPARPGEGGGRGGGRPAA